MIKPNELRIGNIIHCITNELDVVVQYPHPAKIVVDVKWPDGGGCDFVDGDIEEFKPIPITPEWLERCGFVKTDFKYHDGSTAEAFVKDRFVIRLINLIDRIGYRAEWFPSTDSQNGLPGWIDYVHQLQNNYYWWTNGEELAIAEPVS